MKVIKLQLKENQPFVVGKHNKCTLSSQRFGEVCAGARMLEFISSHRLCSMLVSSWTDSLNCHGECKVGKIRESDRLAVHPFALGAYFCYHHSVL